MGHCVCCDPISVATVTVIGANRMIQIISDCYYIESESKLLSSGNFV